jgi:hypothetical protein
MDNVKCEIGLRIYNGRRFNPIFFIVENIWNRFCVFSLREKKKSKKSREYKNCRYLFWAITVIICFGP